MHLLVLDFDHTVVDDNTDTFVMKLGEGGCIPSEVKASYKKGRWTDFMNNVFRYLHSECHATKSDYEGILKKIPLTANMLDLFEFVRNCEESTDCIIISDSNSWFIDVILDENKLSEAVCKVFTNEASFNSDGLLEIVSHHEHNHPECPKNMCKGKILARGNKEKCIVGCVM